MSSDKLKRTLPEEQGVSSQGILSFIEALEKGNINIHSFMFLRYNQVIAEGWWAPYKPEHKRHVYSVSKSFTSTAIGFAVSEGLLKVEDRVVSFFSEDLPERIDENLGTMRIKDLLSMSTGHAMDTSLALLSCSDGNWVRTILSLPVYFKPGTHFLYNSGASYLLSAIIQKVTGMTLFEYLKPRLFDPLGISDAEWECCPRGINTGGWGLSIRTEDLAKFGLLYLNKGIWNGKAILPEAWITEATALTARTDGPERQNDPAEWKQGYGYQFWRCRHNAYRADGAMGQYCIVMPDQDAIVAITGENLLAEDNQRLLDMVWEYILPSMKDSPLDTNEAVLETLHKKLTTLKLVSSGSGHQPAIEASVSNKRYIMEENELHIHEVIFDFKGDTCVFRLFDSLGEHRIVCGKNEWMENEAVMPGSILNLVWCITGKINDRPVKIAAEGKWEDRTTFIVRLQYLETAHHDIVKCSFREGSLEMEMVSSFAKPGNPILKVGERIFRGTVYTET